MQVDTVVPELPRIGRENGRAVMSRKHPLNRLLLRLTLLLVIVGVVGLPIVAKKDKFLPASNPAHFTSSVTKVRLSPLPAISAPDSVPLRVIPAAVVARPVASEYRRLEIDAPPVRERLTSPLRDYRSPPIRS